MPTVSTKIDVVVFLALDGQSPALTSAARDMVAAILDAAGKDPASRHVAVVSGKKDRKDGTAFTAPLGLSPDSFKTIDFDLAPKDALLAASVAGCDAKTSSFPDPHLTTGDGAIVCGKKLLDLAGNTREDLTHSWLWALEPLRGSLLSFLRPEARRIYVFLANGEAEFFDAAAFEELNSVRPAGTSDRVLAVVPQGASSAGKCGAEGAPGTRYSQLASATNGLSVDICSSDATKVAAAFTSLLGGKNP